MELNYFKQNSKFYKNYFIGKNSDFIEYWYNFEVNVFDPKPLFINFDSLNLKGILTKILEY